MPRPASVEIIRHVSDDKLNAMIKNARKGLNERASSKKIYERLMFIKMRYSGRSVEEAAEAIGFSRATGYNTQELWNTQGPENLLPAPNPGRPSRMTEEQKDQLKYKLMTQPMETNDVQTYIHEEFEIEYSMKQVHVILSKMGFRHAMPRQGDRNTQDDLEERYRKNTRMLWTP